jgi:hypothetical protein
VTTSTLTEFVLTRITEDEAVARGAIIGDLDTDAEGRWEFVEVPHEGSWPHPAGKPLSSSTKINSAEWAVHATRHDPARVLAQCAAMRKIVEEIEGTRQSATYTTRILTILLHLASIWSDHPDWREEWAA